MEHQLPPPPHAQMLPSASYVIPSSSQPPGGAATGVARDAFCGLAGGFGGAVAAGGGDRRGTTSAVVGAVRGAGGGGVGTGTLGVARAGFPLDARSVVRVGGNNCGVFLTISSSRADEDEEPDFAMTKTMRPMTRRPPHPSCGAFSTDTRNFAISPPLREPERAVLP